MSSEGPSLEISFLKQVPAGDEHERLVCGHCGFIDYVNPRVVVGAVPVWDDKILLCKRDIEPRSGYWTIPAGFLEKGETTEEGAAREAREEALAEIEIIDLLAVYSISTISQVQLLYRARLTKPEFGVGVESREVRLFAWDDIPWSELSFRTVEWALKAYREVQDQAQIVPFTNPA
jgi:ADP-ribose pyrophosphatase YjhB (NUDIX family)